MHQYLLLQHWKRSCRRDVSRFLKHTLIAGNTHDDTQNVSDDVTLLNDVL